LNIRVDYEISQPRFFVTELLYLHTYIFGTQNEIGIYLIFVEIEKESSGKSAGTGNKPIEK